jgi:hypothetical protein
VFAGRLGRFGGVIRPARRSQAERSKGFAVGRPRPLFKDGIPPWLNGGYDVAPDGQSLLTMEVEEDGAKRIVVVLDWFEELKRLVPAGS